MRSKAISMRTLALKLCLNSILLGVLACGSFGQTGTFTENISAGNGTLTYTATVTANTCQVWQNNHFVTYTFYRTEYSSFSYTASGTTTPLAQTGEIYSNWDVPAGCPYVNIDVGNWVYSGVISFSFTPSGETGGSAEASYPGVIYPKYQVQSIIYSAPGNKSSNGYSTTETDGSSTSIGNSFATSDSMTYTAGLGFLGFSSSVSWSSGNSATTGNTTAVTQTITEGAGVANASNSNNPNAINHLQDLFVVWINPAIIIFQTGNSSVGWAQGTQLQTTGDPSPGKPEAYQDQVEIFAQEMQANANGNTTVPLTALEQWEAPDGETLPGLASICANLKTTEYLSNSCTMADQCGCVPADFTAILNQDPLLDYTTTESPLSADTSGPTACANPTSSDKCRYVPVTASLGSTVQLTELLCGPQNQGGNGCVNTDTLSDAKTTTQTFSEQDSYTISFSVQVGYSFLGNGFSYKDMNQWTWTNSESTGEINGYANTMSAVLNSSTLDCYEQIPIFEDTVYHTFVFQQPADNTSCP